MKNFLQLFFGIPKRKRTPTQYQRVDVGDDFSADFEELIKKNKELLRMNGVNLNKIRFIFAPSFHYDIENNVVNPTFTAFIPLRTDGSGDFDEHAPIVEVDKPKETILDTVHSYVVEDNYEFIKELTKRTKRGIVIYIIEHEDAVKDDGTLFSYEYGVDAETLRLRNLDDVNVDVEETQQIL